MKYLMMLTSFVIGTSYVLLMFWLGGMDIFVRSSPVASALVLGNVIGGYGAFTVWLFWKKE